MTPGEFFWSITTNLTASALHSVFNALSKTPLFPRYVHYREVRELVATIPFVYRDLEGEVLHDFVDPDYAASDSTLRPRRDEHINHRLRNHKYVLILGDAGIGKTTFMRHEILTWLSKQHEQTRYFDGEQLIPFYVPFKVLDNSTRFPILTYLAKTYSYPKRRSVRWLAANAAKCRLFLVLDGYDEMDPGDLSQDQKRINFVNEELGYIFGSDDVRAEGRLSEDYRAFYEHLGKCRVWLSSRREFLDLQPIDTRQPGSGTARKPLSVSLAGVGSNRRRLADKIFDKYRRRSGRYADILSAEYFVQEIDRTQDRQLIELSYNPLFLTIMAYIYSEKALAKGHHEVTFGQTLSELIAECISLLLIDLDTQKARGLGRAQRAALLRRRNSYTEEKREFLKYFASRLVYEGKNVFGISFIRERAITYFSSEHIGPNNAVILQELNSRSYFSNDLALQLVFSGLFVIVDRNEAGSALYDFPHRRFREVLAAQFFDDRDDRDTVLSKCLDRSELVENLYVFFTISRSKEQLVRAILDRARGCTDKRFGLIALHCIKSAEATFDAADVLWAFFEQTIKDDALIVLPNGLIAFLRLSRERLERLATYFIESVRAGRLYATSVAYELLMHRDRERLAHAVESLSYCTDFSDPQVGYFLYVNLWNLNHALFLKALPPSSSLRRLYLLVATEAVARGEMSMEQCSFLLRQLSFTDQLHFAAMLHRAEPAVLGKLRSENALSATLAKSLLVLTAVDQNIGFVQYGVWRRDLPGVHHHRLQRLLNERYGSLLRSEEFDKRIGCYSESPAIRASFYISRSLTEWLSSVQRRAIHQPARLPIIFGE